MHQRWTSGEPQTRVQHKTIALRFALVAVFWALGIGAFAQQPDITKKNVPQTSSQTAQALPYYEGQNVAAIEVAGRPNLDTARFAPLFVQHVGEPFSTEKVNQTIAAIKREGKFKEIRLVVLPESNGLEVLMVLEPAVYFGVFQFHGAGWFAYSRLLQVTSYPPEAAYNATDIERARDNLLNYCRQEGFFQAQVTPETQVDQAHDIANVIFHMKLGPHSKFGQVKINGTTSEEARKLTHDLGTLWARLKGAAVRPGKSYHHKTLTKAVRLLEGKLSKQGRLAAHVTLAGAEYHAGTNRADITFDVDTGPLVRVKVEGAHLWSWTKRSLLPIYQGAGVNREIVQEGQQALLSYFQSKGYFDAQVSSKFEKQGGDAYQFLYQITKGKRHKVIGVQIRGNQKINADQLRPFVQIKKAHFLSRGKYSEKLVRSSVKNLTNFYNARGFSDATVTPAVEKKDGNIDVTFKIKEDTRDKVQTLRVDGADTLPQSQYAPGGLHLKVGGPYSQTLIEEDRKNILAHYLNSGYPTATFRETARAVSKRDPHDINVVYQIQEGPRVTIHNVYTLGREDTQQRLIDPDISALRPGAPFNETDLLSAESRLYDHPGVFNWAEIDPKRRITTQTDEDVLVKVHEAPKNQITYGFGFELINRGGSVPSGTVAIPNLPPVGLPSSFRTSQKTFWGPRGTIEYTRNNVLGRGQSISLTVFAGRLNQRGAAYYIDPHLFWSNWRSTASITAEHNAQNPIYSSNQEGAGYQVQRELDKAKTRTLFFRYTFSHTDLTRLEIPDLVPPADRDVQLSTISTAFIRDTRDNVLDAHKGLLESATLDFNATQLGASVDFAKLNTQVAYYKEVGKGIVWANSLRIGLAQQFADSRVPLSELFFTGGGSTLRGFPLDSAGPQRQVAVCNPGSTTDCSKIQVPTGGQELLLINSEFRIPLPIKKNLGMAVFYDGGNVFPRVGFHDFTSLYSNNVGLGLRYETPVGPIRLDLGRNLNPVPGIQATQYFISIGQAF